MNAQREQMIREAFEAGREHGKRTDLPKNHNVHKLASDKYPNRGQDEMFEAFMQGYDATHFVAKAEGK
jgi:hypothetical protein